MSNAFAFLRVLLISSVVLLVLVAMEGRSDGYYTLMRLVVCGTAGFSAWICWKSGQKAWMGVMVVLAVLFNPLIPVRWGRDEWTAVGVVSAAAFGGFAWALRGSLKG